MLLKIAAVPGNVYPPSLLNPPREGHWKFQGEVGSGQYRATLEFPAGWGGVFKPTSFHWGWGVWIFSGTTHYCCISATSQPAILENLQHVFSTPEKKGSIINAHSNFHLLKFIVPTFGEVKVV